MAPVFVDTVTLGPVQVPRLFLGDHGFLAKLGSTMVEAEIEERMVRMLALAEIGLAAGEPRVLSAARRAATRGCSKPPIMIHADLRVTLGGIRIRYRRCAATLRTALTGAEIDFTQDPVLGFLEQVGSSGIVIDGPNRDQLELDRGELAILLTDVLAARPAVVTVGGDWLDMLLLAGRQDLVLEGLQSVGAATTEVGSALLLATYVGALVDIGKLSTILRLVDGLMLPINCSGAAMLPSVGELWRWINIIGKPVVAMHALAGGDRPSNALSHLFKHPAIATAVVGASSFSHQDELAAAADELFGEAPG